VAQAVHEDLYLAIDDAARRIRRALQRVATRHIGRERKDRQRPGTLVTL
jgi:ribosome-associated translation inhibitor RaiA